MIRLDEINNRNKISKEMGLNEDYKKRHKPVSEGKSRYHQGYYRPQMHPEKWFGGGDIIYRSGLEYDIYNNFCDRDASVKRCMSEVLAVPYLNPVKNFDKCIREGMDPNNPYNWVQCKYNIDLWMEFEYQDKVHKIFVEIKPYAQTLPPKMPEPGSKPKQFKAYNEAAKTFAVNRAKWIAAKKYCEERGCWFIIITERFAKKPNELHYHLVEELFLKPKFDGFIVI